MNGLTIRHEQPRDKDAIFALTKAAFATMPFSDGDEPELVNQLRSDGDLTLSLIAEKDRVLVGHIAFSPVRISDRAQDWYSLGPVSADIHLQRQGIGSALINTGIAEMKGRGARGIILLGSNEYYPRFGFEHKPQLTYPGPPPEFFQALLLAGEWPSGEVKYAPAFG